MREMQKNIFEQELGRSGVFTNKNFVSPHYSPNELLFREQQVREIMRNIAGCLRGEHANNLFIYGVTGSGKTCVTKHVVQQLLDYGRAKNAPADGCYINCRTHSSKYRAMAKVVSEFCPNENFMGYSAAFMHERIASYVADGKQVVVVLDEIDMVKDVDELVYAMTRMNDEVKKGSISIIGISNNLGFKETLDTRTRSSLCEEEMVFPPYNAEELYAILKQRAEMAFKAGAVSNSAIGLAAAYAAQESGDARTAVMLLLRAGELADKKGLSRITDIEVKKAKSRVEDEIAFSMISTLPKQEKLVLYAIAKLSLERKPLKRLTGEESKGVLYSGEVYDAYLSIAKHLGEQPISSRWYRQYINDLETYGLISTTASGKGMKGQTRFIRLGQDAKRVKELIEKELAG